MEQNEQILREFNALKSDVAEMKKLIKELHALTIPAVVINPKRALTKKEKKELEFQELQQFRRQVHLRMIQQHTYKH